ncbi:MAG TPA: 3-deoxy-D-manno-octulosonic acid transferase, partial [Alphaproteobacteria bacterium]|nr:3-deoxy-D-manno-octulosonic acid transferase [Alphaproteobacteria bacterium]
MSRAVYRALASVAEPALRIWLDRRAGRDKEEAQRLGERRGHASRPRPAGRLLWVHAASLGETRSVLGLIERIVAMHPRIHVLLTSFTVTAGRLVAERPPANTIHQFVPLDVPRWIARFLDHWRPDAAIWVEGELWPNLVAAAQQRGFPMALVNARLSSRSFARWRAARALFPAPLEAFMPVLAQSAGDAERLQQLGAVNVRYVGNLKFDGAPLAFDTEELTRLRTALGGRPIWLAASTHPGEESIVAQAHRALTARRANLLTIIVPRHATRGAEIAATLAADGIAVARRTPGDTPTAAHGVYLADTMGELGLFYRLAGLAFIGGSLVPHGGQNPLEAARLDCALVFGPHMANFRDIAAELIVAHGAIEIRDAESLAAAIGRMLDDPAERMRCAAAAAGVAAAGRGAIDRVLAG